MMELLASDVFHRKSIIMLEVKDDEILQLSQNNIFAAVTAGERIVYT